MKRFWAMLLACAIVFSVVGLAGCRNNDDEHQNGNDNDLHTCTDGEWQTLIEPTCDSEGKKQKICFCGKVVETETIPMLPHNESNLIVDVENTCEEDGFGYVKCLDCNNILHTENIPAGHTVVIDEAVEPTCISKGLTEGSHCSVCYEVIVEQQEIPEGGHAFGEWHLVPANACAGGEYSVRVCLACFTVEYSPEYKGIIHPHDFNVYIKDATCTEAGYVEFTCKNCGIVGLKDTLKAKGHDLKCIASEAGHYNKCVRNGCGYVETLQDHIMPNVSLCVDAKCSACGWLLRDGLGHIWNTNYTVEEHYHYIACKRVGCTDVKSFGAHTNSRAKCIDMIAICDVCKAGFVPHGHHTFGEWEVTKDQTCTDYGEKQRKCVDCGYTQKIKLYPYGHHCSDWTTIVEPTCTERGERKGECDRCEEKMTDSVGSLGHNWSEYTQTPTHHQRHCLRCEIYSELQEHYGGNKTCTNDAVCAACGYVYDKATGHDFETEYSCDSKKHYFLCKNGCGTRIEEEEHTLVGKYETIEVTDTGSQILYNHRLYLECSICGYQKSIKTVVGSEHYGVALMYSVEPTCTQTGLTWGWKCAVTGCNEVYQAQEIIPALGHDLVDNICTRCGFELKSDGLEFTSNNDGTCYVSGIGTCKDTDIIIPKTSPTGDKVTAIGEEAFRVENRIEKVEIPNTVTNIGRMAFGYCGKLSSVEIPNSVTTIGDAAFYHCRSLTSIIIPASVTRIESRTFSGCTSLTSITVDTNNRCYKSIDGNLYYYYHMELMLLEYAPGKTANSFTIPSGVNFIQSLAFEDCTSLTSITIPDSVTGIDDYSFHGCTNLTSITVDTNNRCYKSIDGNLYSKDEKVLLFYAIGKTATSFVIPDGVTSIRNEAFEGCTSLTNIIMPNSVMNIGDYAFSGCTSLTGITISESVTRIESHAFSGCRSLTSIIIPNSVISIEYGAFSGCTSITSIIIPSSVISIGEYALYCSSITSVTFENPDGWWYSSTSSASSGTNISSTDLEDASTAATYLKSTYVNMCWKRS